LFISVTSQLLLFLLVLVFPVDRFFPFIFLTEFFFFRSSVFLYIFSEEMSCSGRPCYTN
jgi:hypothetical protein